MVNIAKKETQPRKMQTYEPQVSDFSLIDRFFDDAFASPFSMLSPTRSVGIGGMSTTFPKVDVSETEKEIKVVANIPGIDPEKIDIEVGDDYLSLSGRIEKENKTEDKAGKIYRYEREYGEFRREFALPTRVNKEGIVAKAKNGVLSVTLPKSEDERKAKVKIEVE